MPPQNTPYGPILTPNTGTISHVGQLFFDQALIDAVEATLSYKANRQPLTPNAKDGFLEQEAATTDPVMEFVLLGEKVEEGLFAWITVGIDARKERNVVAAEKYDPLN